MAAGRKMVPTVKLLGTVAGVFGKFKCEWPNAAEEIF